MQAEAMGWPEAFESVGFYFAMVGASWIMWWGITRK